jgi:hypothetical protein
LRKQSHARKATNSYEVFTKSTHEDLETFIKAHYLLEVDVFNPNTFQMHLVFGKPMVFLVFDSYLDFKKDADLIDFLKLKVK